MGVQGKSGLLLCLNPVLFYWSDPGLEGIILHQLDCPDPSPLPGPLRLQGGEGGECHRTQNVFSIKFKLKMGIKIDTFSAVSLSHNIFPSLVPPRLKNTVS